MNKTLEPRLVEEKAPDKWAKESWVLFKRTVLTLLPLSLLLGLGFAHVIEQNFLIGITLAITLSGIFQNIILYAYEEAAKGKSINVGTIFEGFKIYAAAPNNVMLKQLMVRFSIVGGVSLVLFLITLLADPAKSSDTVEAFSGLGYLFELAGHVVTVFIWSWCFQQGGSFSFSSILVRNFGINWDMAYALSEQGRQKNIHCFAKNIAIFFIPTFTAIFFPILIFVWPLFWMGYLVSAYRDIFEHEDGLAEKQKQESGAGVVYGRMLEA